MESSPMPEVPDREIPRAAPRASGEGGGLRVLLVEDEIDTARLVARRLRFYPSASFEVIHVPDLRSAFAELEQGRFDAMLLDLGLPDGDGLSTLGPACALARHLPILVLTAREDEEMSLTAVRAGAQDYLQKPIHDSRTLGRAILHALERHRRQALELRTPGAPPEPR